MSKVKVYCIVGSFYQRFCSSFFPCTVMPCIECYCHFLYVIFCFVFLFYFESRLKGFFILLFFVICNFWTSLYHVLFFIFWLMNFEISSQKRTERRDSALSVSEKDCSYCFNIILLRHLNKRRVIILCCFSKVSFQKVDVVVNVILVDVFGACFCLKILNRFVAGFTGSSFLG